MTTTRDQLAIAWEKLGIDPQAKAALSEHLQRCQKNEKVLSEENLLKKLGFHKHKHPAIAALSNDIQSQSVGLRKLIKEYEDKGSIAEILKHVTEDFKNSAPAQGSLKYIPVTMQAGLTSISNAKHSVVNFVDYMSRFEMQTPCTQQEVTTVSKMEDDAVIQFTKESYTNSDYKDQRKKLVDSMLKFADWFILNNENKRAAIVLFEYIRLLNHFLKFGHDNEMTQLLPIGRKSINAFLTETDNGQLKEKYQAVKELISTESFNVVHLTAANSSAATPEITPSGSNELALAPSPKFFSIDFKKLDKSGKKDNFPSSQSASAEPMSPTSPTPKAPNN